MKIFQFAQPEYLWLIICVPCFFTLWWVADRHIYRRLQIWIQTSPLNADISSVTWSILVKRVSLSCAFLLLCIALARPQYDYVEIEVRSTGREVMILFDLSTSMLATDQQPSRLEVAQREVIELLKSLEGDRIGIIGFAGSAFVQCPMTSDYEMIRLFLSQLDPHQVSWQGTAIADAILLGQKHLLREQQKARNDKMMILITDGEDQQGEAAQAALQAQRAGIPVHILGVGTEQGSPIPGKDGKFKKNHQGELILSRLNRTHLQELAQTTHGIFEQLRPGAGALTQLYKVAINQLTQNDIEDSPFERSHRIWYERFRPLVIAALLLLIFESLLQRFKRYEA